MHLDTQTLLAYHDGELSGRRWKMADSHLAACARCRREARQLEYELDLFLTLPETGPPSGNALLEQSLDEMLTGIRRWRSDASLDNAGGPQLECRIEAEVTKYLGSGTAAGVKNLAGSSSGNTTGSLPVAEPLLSVFLGRKAASALISELLVGMAIERRLVPELLP